MSKYYKLLEKENKVDDVIEKENNKNDLTINQEQDVTNDNVEQEKTNMDDINEFDQLQDTKKIENQVTPIEILSGEEIRNKTKAENINTIDELISFLSKQYNFENNDKNFEFIFGTKIGEKNKEKLVYFENLFGKDVFWGIIARRVAQLSKSFENDNNVNLEKLQNESINMFYSILSKYLNTTLINENRRRTKVQRNKRKS